MEGYGSRPVSQARPSATAAIARNDQVGMVGMARGCIFAVCDSSPMKAFIV